MFHASIYPQAEHADEKTPTRDEIIRAANAANTIRELGDVWPMIHGYNLHRGEKVDFGAMMQKAERRIAAAAEYNRSKTQFSAIA